MDFFSTPLDHHLNLGQQVVFQSLELQEVPISLQRLLSHSYQRVNLQKAEAVTQTKLTTEPATSSTPILRLFVFPGLTYLTTDQKDLTWPGPQLGSTTLNPFYLVFLPSRVYLPSVPCVFLLALP